MSVRERLTQLCKLDSLINCKLRQYDILRRPTADFCREKVKALAQEINADIDRLCDEKRAIMALIDGTEDLTELEMVVLYKHYLEGESYDAIAKEKHYSKTSIFRTCTKAVQKVENRWKNT